MWNYAAGESPNHPVPKFSSRRSAQESTCQKCQNKQEIAAETISGNKKTVKTTFRFYGSSHQLCLYIYICMRVCVCGCVGVCVCVSLTLMQQEAKTQTWELGQRAPWI